MGKVVDLRCGGLLFSDASRYNVTMDDRARSLLKALIERYISDGQPVGSRTLSKVFDLSPATIRNVMADLEDLGLIHSPHTSSGRIPTPRGYRVFVDSLLTVQPYEVAEESRIQTLLPFDDPQRVMNAAAALLSNLTQFAGVVQAPRRSQSFSQIEFIRLPDQRILLIIVTPEGDVQNRILQSSRDYSASELSEAARFLNQHFVGRSFDEVRQALQQDLRDLRRDISRLMEQALDAGEQVAADNQDAVLISGELNLLSISDLSMDIDRLRRMFSVFEQKTSLIQLLDISKQAQGVQIYIGGDSQLVPTEDLTVVTAPYGVDGKVVGTLGVIGPTRMSYERVIPIVDITARLLSNALSHH